MFVASRKQDPETEKDGLFSSSTRFIQRRKTPCSVSGGSCWAVTMIRKTLRLESKRPDSNKEKSEWKNDATYELSLTDRFMGGAKIELSTNAQF